MFRWTAGTKARADRVFRQQDYGAYGHRFGRGRLLLARRSPLFSSLHDTTTDLQPAASPRIPEPVASAASASPSASPTPLPAQHSDEGGGVRHNSSKETTAPHLQRSMTERSVSSTGVLTRMISPVSSLIGVARGSPPPSSHKAAIAQAEKLVEAMEAEETKVVHRKRHRTSPFLAPPSCVDARLPNKERQLIGSGDDEADSEDYFSDADETVVDTYAKLQQRLRRRTRKRRVNYAKVACSDDAAAVKAQKEHHRTGEDTRRGQQRHGGVEVSVDCISVQLPLQNAQQISGSDVGHTTPHFPHPHHRPPPHVAWEDDDAKASAFLRSSGSSSRREPHQGLFLPFPASVELQRDHAQGTARFLPLSLPRADPFVGHESLHCTDQRRFEERSPYDRHGSMRSVDTDEGAMPEQWDIRNTEKVDGAMASAPAAAAVGCLSNMKGDSHEAVHHPNTLEGAAALPFPSRGDYAVSWWPVVPSTAMPVGSGYVDCGTSLFEDQLLGVTQQDQELHADMFGHASSLERRGTSAPPPSLPWRGGGLTDVFGTGKGHCGEALRYPSWWGEATSTSAAIENGEADPFACQALAKPSVAAPRCVPTAAPWLCEGASAPASLPTDTDRYTQMSGRWPPPMLAHYARDSSEDGLHFCDSASPATGVCYHGSLWSYPTTSTREPPAPSECPWGVPTDAESPGVERADCPNDAIAPFLFNSTFQPLAQPWHATPAEVLPARREDRGLSAAPHLQRHESAGPLAAPHTSHTSCVMHSPPPSQVWAIRPSLDSAAGAVTASLPPARECRVPQRNHRGAGYPRQLNRTTERCRRFWERCRQSDFSGQLPCDSAGIVRPKGRRKQR